jgi:hypothetical protein
MDVGSILCRRLLGANRDRPKAKVSNIAHLQNRRSTTSPLAFTLFPFDARWLFLPFL